MVLYTVVPDPADAAVIIQTLRPGAREFLHDLDASVMRLYRAGAADPGVSRVIVVIALWAHVIPVAVPGHVDTVGDDAPVSYTHLRAHETKANLVCRLLLEK